MNLKTWNDEFLTRVPEKQDGRFYGSRLVDDIKKCSPLFIHNLTNLGECINDKLNSQFIESGLALPFDSMRVSLTASYENVEEEVKIDYVVRKCPEAVYFDSRVRGDINGVPIFYHGRITRGETLAGSSVDVFCYFNGKIVTDDYRGQTGKITASYLMRFLLELNNPNIQVAKVLPARSEHRTVTWIKPREHFVLIHKSIGKELRDGKKFSMERNLLRASHSRRAHFRMLNSDKFRNKKGQRVFVRSAWVGPKEWFDCSGQKYIVT